jgi:hypothetical protein
MAGQGRCANCVYVPMCGPEELHRAPVHKFLGIEVIPNKN